MSSHVQSVSRSVEQGRMDLLGGLRERRREVELAALAKVFAVSEPIDAPDPEYMDGLRAAVSAALDYGFVAVEQGDRSSPPIPITLRAQARLAARNGVSLDTVLRRYFAGYTVLSDFLVEEAERGGVLRGASLKRLLHTQSTLFDRLIVAVSEDYNHEAGERCNSKEERRAEQVQRLLAGEALTTTSLAYELDAHHLGLIATGPGAADAIEAFVKPSDYQHLGVRRDEGSAWAWFGTRQGFDHDWLGQLTSASWPSEVSVAIGEPGHGLGGWRLTHRQARATLPIAVRAPKGPVRYADVALMASVLRDDLLTTSLQELYLAPLAEERDGGQALRETLRAYFAAEHNVSSAAAALGVNRHTVSSRLRAVEERLGRSLSSCAAEMDAALRLEDLGYPLFPHVAFSCD